MQLILTWLLFVNYSLQALALLSEFIEKDDTIIKIGAILGLGIASAGTNKDEVEFLFILYKIFSFLKNFFLADLSSTMTA